MKYPIGIQHFESLRQDGFVYVDKTALVYKLAQEGRYYFLSRPRRFGKSLLLSTFEAYFEGKRQLFKGLAIEQLEREWECYPILHLDLNTENYREKENLEIRLNRTLTLWEKQYGRDEVETSLALRFEGVVRRAYEQTGKRVVILVDEYDKPMQQSFDNAELQEHHRMVLKTFYSVLKTQDRYIRFALLTGVTKFGKVSVFSDLNNLDDISMDARYASICGITEVELHQYFDEEVNVLADSKGMTSTEMYSLLRRQYDGYHFQVDTEGLYNPFSLLNALSKKAIGDYWFETGTPELLVRLMQLVDYDLSRLSEEEVAADVLNSLDSMFVDPVPVIYQSGYLTIKGYDREFDTYRMGFPNEEVERGFNRYLVPFYTPLRRESSAFTISQFVKAVRQGDPERFLSLLQTLFDDVDYRIAGHVELYFQNAFYLIFRLMGFYTQVERATSRGRVDVVIQTADYIYVVEVKLDGSAVEALQQINDKGYARPFAQDGRKIYKIGVNFSSTTRGVEEWKIEE